MLPRSTERVSGLFWSSVYIDFTVVPSFTKIALSYLSCGSSAIQVIPFALGRWLCGPRWVSCKQRTLHLCLKHIFAIRSSLAADSPSMFRDITVIDGFEKVSFEYRLDDDIFSGFDAILIRVQRKFLMW